LAQDRPGIDADAVAIQLLELAGKAAEAAGRRKAAGPPKAPSPEELYRVEGGCLCRVTSMPFCAPIPTPLCNFDARITESVVHDDGVEETRSLTISGTLASGETLPAITVGMEEFARGDWPLTRWGNHAVVYAGQGTKDHLRVAVQLLSQEVARRTVYTHTGWRKIGETWAYLHAEGAIGPAGVLAGVETALPDALDLYRLPTPPTGEALVTAVRASLDLTRDLAPDKVVLPLLMTTYRSVLLSSDYSAHAVGKTGSFKTELATLMQQHFGPDMHAKNLPASWSSTGNSLEVIAFSAKDTLLVIDDFAPTGSTTDIQRYHREAERLFRAQANRSGRQRLRSDGSLRPTKPPRGSILSTGEDVPKGHSLRARLLVVEVGSHDIDQHRLTPCQQQAAEGLYAQAMAAYIQWLSPQYETIVGNLKVQVPRGREEITEQLGADQHRRVPTLVADLLATFDPFLKFAQEVGAITLAEADLLRQRSREALLSVAADQAALQAAADPVDRYLSLLASTLSSGRAHVTTTKGEAPGADPLAWGWRYQEGAEDHGGDWRPQGKQIGWLDQNDLYLDPDSAFAEVQRLANDQGESLGTSQGTLHKRLLERNLLVSVRAGRLTNRVLIAGRRRDVLHLNSLRLSHMPETGPIGPTGPPIPDSTKVVAHFDKSRGPLFNQGSPVISKTGPTTNLDAAKGNDSIGPIGPIGPVSTTDKSCRETRSTTNREVGEL
jgi:hypothetical protein